MRHKNKRGRYVVRKGRVRKDFTFVILTHKERVTRKDRQRQKNLIIHHLHSDGPCFFFFFTNYHTIIKAEFINGLSQKNTVAFCKWSATLNLGLKRTDREGKD